MAVNDMFALFTKVLAKSQAACVLTDPHNSCYCFRHLQMLAAAVKGVGGGLHSRAGELWALLLRPDLLKLSDFRGAAVSRLLMYEAAGWCTATACPWVMSGVWQGVMFFKTLLVPLNTT